MDHQRDWITRLEKERQNKETAAGMFEAATSPSAVAAVPESTAAVVPGNIAAALPS